MIRLGRVMCGERNDYMDCPKYMFLFVNSEELVVYLRVSDAV